MKIIGKMIKWISDNKQWVFSGIGITILSLFFPVFFGAQTSDTHEDPASGIADGFVQDEINPYGYDDNPASEIETIEDEIIMSESKYTEYLHDNVGEDILYSYYNDYDGDGSCEMFALIGDNADPALIDEGNLCGKIWFINENGVKEVESNEIEYWTSPYEFSIDGKIFIAFEKAYVTGSQTYIWGVRNGRPYQPNISGQVHGLKINEYDEIEVTHSTYDMAYEKSLGFMVGHTWKKYYFYFDGSTFREYGGINIEVEDIIKIPEINKIVNEIYSHSYEIDSIFFRGNNLININIFHESDEEIRYYNITLRYIDNMWCIVPREYELDYEEGYYLRAFIPTVATYPDNFSY